MRLIFLFFLVLNVAYFSWQSGWFQEDEAPVLLREPTLAKGVERLTLLRERGLGTVATPQPAEAAVSDDSQEVVKPVPRKVEAPAEKPAPVAETKKTLEPACFTLGPFQQAKQASKAAGAISALGIVVNSRTESQKIPKGYWVYRPPLPSYADARAEVKMLQAKGLSDLFIMGKGAQQNAISLGLFKSKETADDRFAQVKKMGIEVVLEVQYKVKPLGWLDMEVAGDQTAAVAALADLAEDYPGTSLAQRKCE